MELREKIRIAIGGALAAQEGSDGAADAVMEVLAKQEPIGHIHGWLQGSPVIKVTAPVRIGMNAAVYLVPGAKGE